MQCMLDIFAITLSNILSLCYQHLRRSCVCSLPCPLTASMIRRTPNHRSDRLLQKIVIAVVQRAFGSCSQYSQVWVLRLIALSLDCMLSPYCINTNRNMLATEIPSDTRARDISCFTSIVRYRYCKSLASHQETVSVESNLTIRDSIETVSESRQDNPDLYSRGLGIELSGLLGHHPRLIVL
jgi:hypothetical protein